MKCSVCGTEIGRDAERCHACGHPVDRSADGEGIAGRIREAVVSATSSTDPEKKESADGAAGGPDDQSAGDESAGTRAPSWNSTMVTMIAIAGTVLMAASSVINNMEDNPLKKYYLALIAIAVVLIPFIQVLAQRRIMAGQYLRNLDILHDLLEKNIDILIDPNEKIVDEAVSLNGGRQELLLLTPRRLAWITTKQSRGELRPVAARHAQLGAIDKTTYKRLSGNLTARLDTGEKLSFRLPASRHAEGFAAQLDYRISHAPRTRASAAGDPAPRLCLRCGRETLNTDSLCNAHSE